MVVVPLLLMASVSVNAANYENGIDYIQITPIVSPVSTFKEEVEVVELFWYMSPYCFRFESNIKKWLKTKPKNVVFRRVPAIFSPRWRFFAKIYYTNKLLGIEDIIHEPLFKALHEEHAQLGNEAAITKFVEKHTGVKKQKFMDVFNSSSVDARVRKAEDLSKRYGAEGVPTLVVNGTWRTNGTMADGQENMIKVLDHLIRHESK